MKVYVRPRQGGKTHELIELAAEEQLTIVCSTLEMVRNVEQRARDMNLDIPKPVSWRYLARGGLRGRRVKGLLVDDADACLQDLAGPVPVVALSLTGEVVQRRGMAMASGLEVLRAPAEGGQDGGPPPDDLYMIES
jgi:hypothetical protein